MKLDLVFVRYLLTRGNKKLPQEVRPAAKKLNDVVKCYGGDNSELRTFGALLILNSELEESEADTLNADLLAALEENPEEFMTADSWDLIHTSAALIKRFGCAQQVFKIMAKHEVPTMTFEDLVGELKKLGITLPTNEEWEALKPPPKPVRKPRKGKKGGRNKKK